MVCPDRGGRSLKRSDRSLRRECGDSRRRRRPHHAREDRALPGSASLDRTDSNPKAREWQGTGKRPLLQKQTPERQKHPMLNEGARLRFWYQETIMI